MSSNLYEKVDRLIKSGVQKDRGFLVDLRAELYKVKGDETEISQSDTRRVQRLFDMYFQGTVSTKRRKIASNNQGE